MVQILSTVAPLFIVIAVGYAAVKFLIIDAAHIPSFGRFVLYFAIPALIFLTLGGTDVHTIIEPWFLVAYGAGMLATYGIAFALFKFQGGNSFSLAAIKSIGSAFPNSAFVGYPLLLQVFEVPPISAFAMALMFENIVMMPFVLLMMEVGGAKGSGKPRKAIIADILKRLIGNPIIIAIFMGTLVSWAQVPLPGVVSGSVEIVAKAAAGAALFYIGGSLVGNQIKGSLPEIGMVTTIKLLVHPLIVAGLVFLLPGFDRNLQMAAILLAASPMMSIFPIIGARYGFRTLCGSMLLVATATSFVTISIFLGLF